MTIDFKLINLQPSNHPLTGYVHIIAESRKTDPPRIWTYPREKLQNGAPVDFRQGELYTAHSHFGQRPKNELLQCVPDIWDRLESGSKSID